MPKPITIVIVIAVLSGIAYFTFVTVGSAGDLQFHPIPFDSPTWKSSPAVQTHESIRLCMVDDFLESRAPVGQAGSRIIALLGEPDQNEYFGDYDLVYLLGQERSGFGVESEWLVLRLDGAGTVADARVLTE